MKIQHYVDFALKINEIIQGKIKLRFIKLQFFEMTSYNSL